MITSNGIATPIPALAPVEIPELPEPDGELLFGVEGPVELLPPLVLLLEVGGFVDVVPSGTFDLQTNEPWMILLDASFWNSEQSTSPVLSIENPPLTLASDGKLGLFQTNQYGKITFSSTALTLRNSQSNRSPHLHPQGLVD